MTSRAAAQDAQPTAVEVESLSTAEQTAMKGFFSSPALASTLPRLRCMLHMWMYAVSTLYGVFCPPTRASRLGRDGGELAV